MSRSIFEEVGADAPKGAEPPRSGEEARAADRRAVRIWILALAVLVTIQIIVGGLTRITDSGLSITDWSVMGSLPPLSTEGWQEVFTAYQQTTEFKEQNFDMTLEEFKPIFWWEWGHRMWGRLIGLVFLIPFAWFLYRKTIPSGWLVPILIAGALGASQAVIGKVMVESGLTGRLDVSQHKLALHKGVAYLILGILFWIAFSLKRTDVDLLQARRRRESGMWTASRLLLAFVGVQIVIGAYVAGMNAGDVYREWPMMGDGFYPPGTPFTPFIDGVDGQAATQFLHRIIAYALFIGAAVYFWRSRRSAFKKTKLWGAIAFGVIVWQVVLGIGTIAHGDAVPLSMAVAHHISALLLFVAVLHAAHQSAYPVEEKIAG